jgi:hypothetical protein
MNLVPDVADAVTQALNDASAAGTLSQSITAERLYFVDPDMTYPDGIYVPVIPTDLQSVPLTRGADQDDVFVDVGLIAKLETNEKQEVDALMALMEEIKSVLRQRLPLPNNRYASWFGRESKLLFSPEHLRERKKFFSITTFAFRC